jgi:hypothetical protein
MIVCDRCGEKYTKGSSYSTPDYCGTCVFINGPLPEPRIEPPQLKYIDRANVRPKKEIDIQTVV